MRLCEQASPIASLICRNRWNGDEMWKIDVEELTSTIEQIGHSLEEHHFKVHHLHVADEQNELDPEENPGSVSYIHKTITSAIRKQVDSTNLASKIRASHEIAIFVGLTSVAISKPPPGNDEAPFSMLRQLHGLDSDVSISQGSKFLLDTWGVAPEIEQGNPRSSILRPRKRVKFDESPSQIAIQPSSQRIRPFSHRDVTPTLAPNREIEITMSQPVRGRYGDSRRKFRKSGF